MIRDPQNLDTVDPAYRDRRKESMGTGSVVGMMLGALLLVAGAIWAFGPQQTTTATNPPPTTTGQAGSSQPTPAPMNPPPVTTGQGGTSQMAPAPVRSAVPAAPSVVPLTPSAPDTNQGVDAEESPTAKK